jgi:hypothetical protein
MEVFKTEVVAQNGTPDRPDLMVSFDDLNDLTGIDFLNELESKYAGNRGPEG